MDNKEFYYKAELTGIRAEGRIGGALRSGRVLDGIFASHGPVGTFHARKASEVPQFKIMEE